MKYFIILCLLLNSLWGVEIEEFIPNSNYTSELSDFNSEFNVEPQIQDSKCPSLDGYNRFITKHNDTIYTKILTPISNGYTSITNEPFRDGVSNFFYNLGFPLRLINNILQFELKDAAEETATFIINSTVGVVGIFKPAQNYFGLKSHREDFGQTLAVYGVGSGCHIVLPFFGPSNARDILGLTLSSQFEVTHTDHHNIRSEKILALKIYEKINNSPNTLKQYKLIKEDALDLYPYMRDIYEQHRQKEIKE